MNLEDQDFSKTHFVHIIKRFLQKKIDRVSSIFWTPGLRPTTIMKGYTPFSRSIQYKKNYSHYYSQYTDGLVHDYLRLMHMFNISTTKSFL